MIARNTGPENNGAQGRLRNSLCLLPSGQLGSIYVPTDVPTEH